MTIKLHRYRRTAGVTGSSDFGGQVMPMFGTPN